MLLTVPSAWIRCESGAVMPMVAATLVTASSTGIPAATSAPKASSIRIRVTGRLIPSAEDRSSATRSLMLASIDRSPASRICSSGWSAWTRFVTSWSAEASSWSWASWTAISNAERSGLGWACETFTTPCTSRMAARISAAALVAAAESSEASLRGLISTFSVLGAARPALSTIASARPDSPNR